MLYSLVEAMSILLVNAKQFLLNKFVFTVILL